MPIPLKTDFLLLFQLTPLPFGSGAFFDAFTSFPTSNTLVSAVRTARGKENGMNRSYLNTTYRAGFRTPVGQAIPTMSDGASCPCRKPDPDKTLSPALAIAYVPSQRFEKLYAAGEALRHGTLFADLDLPYCAGGGR